MSSVVFKKQVPPSETNIWTWPFRSENLHRLRLLMDLKSDLTWVSMWTRVTRVFRIHWPRNSSDHKWVGLQLRQCLRHGWTGTVWCGIDHRWEEDRYIKIYWCENNDWDWNQKETPVFSETTVVCRLGSASAGTYPVSVSFPSLGQARYVDNIIPEFTIQLLVSSLSPLTGSLAGKTRTILHVDWIWRLKFMFPKSESQILPDRSHYPKKVFLLLADRLCEISD